jgi:hypothetical protein
MTKTKKAGETPFEDFEAEVWETPSDPIDHSAVIFSTDWTTETLVGQVFKGNIDLSPRFQRRDAWSVARKSRFVESIILGLPIPQVVLAESKMKKGTFVVLDGKQRLLTLFQFWGEAKSSTNNGFKLEDLELLPDLNGQTYEAMKANDSKHLPTLQNNSIRTAIVRDWKSEEYLHRVFLRLNTGSLPLSPQELRLALTPGPFSEFIDAASSASEPLRKLLGLKAPDARMRDVELMVRYLAFKNFLGGYGGRLKPFIDSAYQKLNAEWEVREGVIVEQVKNFEAGIQLLLETFPAGVARKKDSRLFNRAIFDALIYYFADPITRATAAKHTAATRRGYEKIVVEGPFLASIERDTAGIPNTLLRLRNWGLELKRTLNIELQIPREVNGQIVP